MKHPQLPTGAQHSGSSLPMGRTPYSISLTLCTLYTYTAKCVAHLQAPRLTHCNCSPHHNDKATITHTSHTHDSCKQFVSPPAGSYHCHVPARLLEPVRRLRLVATTRFSSSRRACTALGGCSVPRQPGHCADGCSMGSSSSCPAVLAASSKLLGIAATLALDCFAASLGPAMCLACCAVRCCMMLLLLLRRRWVSGYARQGQLAHGRAMVLVLLHVCRQQGHAQLLLLLLCMAPSPRAGRHLQHAASKAGTAPGLPRHHGLVRQQRPWRQWC